MTFVYVLSHPQGWTKIGYSADPARRLYQHQRHADSQLVGEMACSVPDQAARPIEARAQEMLSGHRVVGEWFTASVEDAVNAVIKAAEESGCAYSRQDFPSKEAKVGGGRSAPIGIRLFPEVKAALEAAAKADRRSVASYVETLIVRDLEAKGHLQPGAAE